jgi:hypothetical protein
MHRSDVRRGCVLDCAATNCWRPYPYALLTRQYTIRWTGLSFAPDFAGKDLAMPPSLAQQVVDRSESLAQRERCGAFLKFCFLVCKHGGVWEASKQIETERVTPRVKDLLTKTAIVPGGLDSWAAISDYVNVQSAFLESLRSAAVFDAALAGGLVRAPLHSRGFSITTGIPVRWFPSAQSSRSVRSYSHNSCWSRKRHRRLLLFRKS